MKDKFKGLVLGLTLGTLMTGSLAYAAGATSIDVYFRELKFMFDGVDKQPDGQSAFIYDGSTYVPLRFVSEAIGKEVSFDNDTGTIYIGKNYGGAGAAIVAHYDGGTVTRVELDTYIAAGAFYAQQPAPSPTPALLQTMAKQLIAVKLLAVQADEAAASQANQTAAAQLAQIRSYFGSAEALSAELKNKGLTEFDLQQYIERNMLAQKVTEQSISDAALQAEYDRQRQADPAAFVAATVRHILVATSDASTGKQLRTDAEALARAKEVRDKLVKGGDFAELAKTYSDDPGSKESGGRYENADIANYVAEFKKAAAELPLHQLSEPVKTTFGYHLIEVEARETKPIGQVRDLLRKQLVGKTFQAFVAQEVPKRIEKLDLPEAK